MEANQPVVNPRVTLDAMGAHLLVFVGVAAIVILLPGPDTAVVTKNVLLHGRRAALGASAGVGAGLSVWTLAAAVGLASVIRASEVAFTVLKVVGALYLMWLGFQALRAARHAPADDEARLTAAHSSPSTSATSAGAARVDWESSAARRCSAVSSSG
jgi:threonine/homoserine/homoserine lactone efflux protein